MWRSITRRGGTAIAVAALGGCAPEAVGELLTPKAQSAGEALGETLSCRPGQKSAEPLVVDWPTRLRTDVEVAMADGVVVARYDCQSLEVLPACRARGGYRFAGVSRKEERVHIEAQDELRANLPFGAVELTQALERGSSIDIALTTVGKQRTSAFAVAFADLEGDCAGATHYLRSSWVGAFAVETDVRGEASGSVSVLGAGVDGTSRARRAASSRDGELAACEQARRDAEAPPEGCGSLLRIELRAIVEEAPAPPTQPSSAPEVDPLENRCPEGFVVEGAGCVAAKRARAYRCAPDDRAECEAQCEQGNAESCYNLAVALRSEREVDRARVGALFVRACDGGSAPACGAAAYEVDEEPRRRAFLGRACDGGEAVSCRILGDWLLRGTSGEKDAEGGMKAMRRACALGERFACQTVAWSQWWDDGDVDGALATLRGSCDRGNGAACSLLGGWLSRCEAGRAPGMGMGDVEPCTTFPRPDARGATEAFAKACRDGYVGTCKGAADRYLAGTGGAADVAVAVDLLERGCPVGFYACEALGRLYAEGARVPKDWKKAFEVHVRGCEARSKVDCYEAARLVGEGGHGLEADPARHRALLEQACRLDSRVGCRELLKALDQHARSFAGDLCDRYHDQEMCDEFVERGGELPPDFRIYPRPPSAAKDPHRF